MPNAEGQGTHPLSLEKLCIREGIQNPKHDSVNLFMKDRGRIINCIKIYDARATMLLYISSMHERYNRIARF